MAYFQFHTSDYDIVHVVKLKFPSYRYMYVPNCTFSSRKMKKLPTVGHCAPKCFGSLRHCSMNQIAPIQAKKMQKLPIVGRGPSPLNYTMAYFQFHTSDYDIVCHVKFKFSS